MDNGKVNQTGGVSYANGAFGQKRARLEDPRRLTVKRMKIVNSFLQEESLQSGRFGAICGEIWIKALAKRFETPTNVGEWTEDPKRTAAVTEWLKNPVFSQKIVELKEKQLKEGNDLEYAPPLSGPCSPVVLRTGSPVSQSNEMELMEMDTTGRYEEVSESEDSSVSKMVIARRLEKLSISNDEGCSNLGLMTSDGNGLHEESHKLEETIKEDSEGAVSGGLSPSSTAVAAETANTEAAEGTILGPWTRDSEEAIENATGEDDFSGNCVVSDLASPEITSDALEDQPEMQSESMDPRALRRYQESFTRLMTRYSTFLDNKENQNVPPSFMQELEMAIELSKKINASIHSRFERRRRE